VVDEDDAVFVDDQGRCSGSVSEADPGRATLQFVVAVEKIDCCMLLTSMNAKDSTSRAMVDFTSLGLCGA
jgi:hypothetical protein